MQLKTLTKVGSISNLSDARYCAGMGVDMIGFSLDEDDEHYISPTEIQAISSWLAGVKLVGETKHFDIDKINDAINTLGLDYIQFDNAHNFDKYQFIAKPIIQKVYVLDANVLHLYLGKVDYILFESKKTDFDLLKVREQLKAFSSLYPILVGSGITADNILTIIDECNIKGIGLKGGKEERPGFKDFDELAEIFEKLSEEE
ncbi:MAG: hypothetical protein RLZZ175_1133 [Bacteroidota bacterium]|jgi:phosphoribosylanthranilate isomerase